LNLSETAKAGRIKGKPKWNRFSGALSSGLPDASAPLKLLIRHAGVRRAVFGALIHFRESATTKGPCEAAAPAT
jgi:hypothetical protein